MSITLTSGSGNNLKPTVPLHSSFPGVSVSSWAVVSLLPSPNWSGALDVLCGCMLMFPISPSPSAHLLPGQSPSWTVATSIDQNLQPPVTRGCKRNGLQGSRRVAGPQATLTAVSPEMDGELPLHPTPRAFIAKSGSALLCFVFLNLKNK